MAEVFINWGDSSGQTITLSGSPVSIHHEYINNSGYTIEISGRTSQISGMTLSGSNITELSGFSDNKLNISSLNLNNNKLIKFPKVNNNLKELYLNHNPFYSGNTTGTTTDYDGNTYHTVVIGNQEWMVENLKTTHYADGTPIPLVTGSTDTDIRGATGWTNSDSPNNWDVFTTSDYGVWNSGSYGSHICSCYLDSVTPSTNAGKLYITFYYSNPYGDVNYSPRLFIYDESNVEYLNVRLGNSNQYTYLINISGSTGKFTLWLYNTDENKLNPRYCPNFSLYNLVLTTYSGWHGLSNGAYCWYNNQLSYKNPYGALYNMHAITDSHGLAPTGWRVANSRDWFSLITYVGGESVAGGFLKETGTTHWNSPNVAATNSFGFTAVGNGIRYEDGTFTSIGTLSYSWTSSKNSNNQYNAILMSYSSSGTTYSVLPVEYGLAVRCVRDIPLSVTNQYSGSTLKTLSMDNCPNSTYTSGSFPNTLNSFSANNSQLDSNSVSNIIKDMYNNPTDKSTMTISLMNTLGVLTGTTEKYDLIDNSGATIKTTGRFELLVDRRPSTNVIPPESRSLAIYFYKPVTSNDITVYINWGDGTEENSTFSTSSTSLIRTHAYYSATTFTVQIDAHWDDISYIYTSGSYYNDCTINLKEFVGLKDINILSTYYHDNGNYFGGVLDFSRNKLLETMNIGYNHFTSMIYPTDVSKIKSIRADYCTGMVAPPTDRMLNLEYLSMQNCNMTGTLVDVASDNLTYYNIGGNYSLNMGPIPNMTNCTGLTDLYLDSCNLNSNGTTDFTTLKSLQHLSITSNYNLTGSVPKIDNLTNLQSISINNTSYTSIGDTDWDTLSGLTNMYMGYNYYLTGQTPTLAASTGLTSYIISYNQFYGNLPDFSRFPLLTNINTYYNRIYNSETLKGISGPLPDVSGNPLLNYIDISDCYLSRHKQFDAVIISLAIDSSGKVYAGGQFTEYSGATQRGIMRFNSNGSRDESFDMGYGCGPYYNGFVYTIAFDSSDKIFAGGYFTTFSGSTQNRLVKINTNGTKDTSFDIGVGFNTEVLCVATGLTNKIYVGGPFTQYGGATQGHLVRLDSGGTVDSSFDVSSKINSAVRSVVVGSSDKVYIGGDFNIFDGYNQPYLMRLNSGGTKDTSFDIGTGFNSGVYSLALSSSEKLYAGGNFTTYNGVTQNYLVRLNSGGTKDTSFDIGTGFNGTVYCIDVDSSGKIYVGGAFTTFSGSTQNRLIRLNTNGTKDTSFDIGTGFNGSIRSIKVDSTGKVYVGGEFTEFNDNPQMYMIRLNSNGTKDTSFVCFEPTTMMNLSYNTNLNGITMRNCNLDYYDDSISGLTSIYNIDLNNNKLKEFPNTSRMTSLSTLYLGGNRINTTIPDTLSANTSLTTINWENNLIHGSIPDWFSGFTNLQTIDISYNRLSGRLPQFLTGFTNINSLRLSQNNFTSGFTALSGLTTNMRQIRIAYNNFSGETMFDLSPFTSMNDIDVSYCNLSGNLKLCDGLQYPYMLYFQNNNLVGNIPAITPGYSWYSAYYYCSNNLFTGYTSMAGSSHYYGHIDFSNNYLSTSEVNKVISDVVKSTQYNGSLDLSGDNMGIPNGQALIDISTLTSKYWTVTVNLEKIGNGGFNSSVHDIEIDSSGKIYVAGRFSTFSGMTNVKLIKLESSGTKVGTFNPSFLYDGNPVYTVAKDSSGHTYAGGYLFYGTENDNLARLDSGGTLDTSFDLGIGFNGSVNDILVNSDDSIYVGGQFTSYRGVVGPKGIIRLNTDGSVDNTFVYGTGFDSPLYKLTVDSNNKVYVCGGFTNYNGSYTPYFAKLNADGTKDTTFVNRVFNSIVDYALSDTINDKIYLAGDFTMYNSLTENHLIRLNLDGTKDETFNIGDGFSNAVLGLESYSDKIYAYGYFTEFSGLTNNRLIRLNSGGTKDTSFDIGEGFNSNVYVAVTGSTGKVYVGGAFTQFSGLTQKYLVRLNSSGTKDTSFDIGEGFNSTVFTLTLDSGGKIYVGGAFTTFSGSTQNYLVRLNSDGTKDTSFDIGSGFNGSISQILLYDGKVYVSGYFTTYSGTTANYFIVLNTDGSIDNTFDIGSGFDNVITSIAMSTNNKFYFGGFFKQFDSLKDDNRLIKLKSDGTKDNTFETGSGFNSSVYGITTNSPNYIYVYGAFSSYNGLGNTNYLVRIDSGGTRDSSFDLGTGFNGEVDDVVIDSSGNLYVGGNFSQFNGVTQPYLVKLNSGGTKDTSFDIGQGFNSFIKTLAIDSSDRIYVGGYFTEFSGVTGTTSSNKYFIRLNSDGTKDETFNIGNGVDTTVYKIKIDASGKILIGGDFSVFNKTSQNRMVRLNDDGSIDNTFYIDTNRLVMDGGDGLMFNFVGEYYQTGTVTVSGKTCVLFVNGSGFIWDYQGSGEYQFTTYNYQTIRQTINGTDFDIRYVSGNNGNFVIKITLGA